MFAAVTLLAASAQGRVAATVATSGRLPVLTFGVAPPAGSGFAPSGGLCGTDLRGHLFRVSDPDRDALPAWSPDGRWIAFTRTTNDHTANHYKDIFVTDAQGRHRRNLTRLVGRGSYSGAAWSPDGKQLAYVSITGIGDTLLIAGSDGTVVRVLDYRQSIGSPSWSPDGSRILYSAFSNGSTTTYLVDTDGSDRRPLIPSAATPVWSPDGSRIAYTTWDRSQASLVVAQADGSDVHVLASNLASRPAWSPDGTTIAFARGKAIVLIRPDGSGERLAATGPFAASDPAWRPAGALPSQRRPCVVRGTAASNRIRGTDRGDLIYAGSGADIVNGGGGDDVLVGGPGNDLLYGADGADTLVGGEGRDRLDAGSGSDVIAAKDGQRDSTFGGPGADGGYFDRRLDRRDSIEFPLYGY